jgi:DNA-binding transcriptional ArsR family regulator
LSEDFQKQILDRLNTIEGDLKRFLSIFKALNTKELIETKNSLLEHELRKKIYDFCDGKLTVNQIAERVKESRQTVDYHLGVLTSSGLVSYKEDGRERYYYKTLE